MAIEALIAGGVLLVAGAAFAVFLGVSSNRIEHQREHDAGKASAH
jgi:hypothetical protein